MITTHRETFTRELFHSWVYFFSLCLFVISLPTSRFMLTVSLIILLVNWLAEANYSAKLNAFLTNKPAIAFTLIYVLNLIGLFWTKNLPYAFQNDLLHKLPTLFLPLIIVTSPQLNAKRIRLLLALFIATVLTVSFIGFTIRMFNNSVDFREASPFIPNIYFSMMLLLAAFQLPLLVKQVSKSQKHFLFSLLVSGWFIYFVFFLRSLSGIAALICISVFSLILLIYSNKNLLLKVTLSSIFIIFLAFFTWLFISMYSLTHHEVKINFSQLEEYSSDGNPYNHDTTNILRENGHLVYIYIQENELQVEWNSKSDIDYNADELMGHSLKHTLYRYMSSKGLTKDKEGFSQLSDDDIEAVENGTTNYLYNTWPGLFIRAHQMMMGVYMYRKSSYKNPTWSTLTERIDLWRASWHAFKKYPLFGWGTGSILNAVDYGLEKNDSGLIGKNMKPHNQYIFLLLTLGIFGLISFMLLYTYVVIKTKAFKIYIFMVFLIIFATFFLANNAFESQVGQNLFVFFTLLYCYFYPQLKGRERFIY